MSRPGEENLYSDADVAATPAAVAPAAPAQAAPPLPPLPERNTGHRAGGDDVSSDTSGSRSDLSDLALGDKGKKKQGRRRLPTMPKVRLGRRKKGKAFDSGELAAAAAADDKEKYVEQIGSFVFTGTNSEFLQEFFGAGVSDSDKATKLSALASVMREFATMGSSSRFSRSSGSRPTNAQLVRLCQVLEAISDDPLYRGAKGASRVDEISKIAPRRADDTAVTADKYGKIAKLITGKDGAFKGLEETSKLIRSADNPAARAVVEHRQRPEGHVPESTGEEELYATRRDFEGKGFLSKQRKADASGRSTGDGERQVVVDLARAFFINYASYQSGDEEYRKSHPDYNLPLDTVVQCCMLVEAHLNNSEGIESGHYNDDFLPRFNQSLERRGKLVEEARQAGSSQAHKENELVLSHVRYLRALLDVFKTKVPIQQEGQEAQASEAKYLVVGKSKTLYVNPGDLSRMVKGVMDLAIVNLNHNAEILRELAQVKKSLKALGYELTIDTMDNTYKITRSALGTDAENIYGEERDQTADQASVMSMLVAAQSLGRNIPTVDQLVGAGMTEELAEGIVSLSSEGVEETVSATQGVKKGKGFLSRMFERVRGKKKSPAAEAEAAAAELATESSSSGEDLDNASFIKTILGNIDSSPDLVDVTADRLRGGQVPEGVTTVHEVEIIGSNGVMALVAIYQYPNGKYYQITSNSQASSEDQLSAVVFLNNNGQLSVQIEEGRNEQDHPVMSGYLDGEQDFEYLVGNIFDHNLGGFKGSDVHPEGLAPDLLDDEWEEEEQEQERDDGPSFSASATLRELAAAPPLPVRQAQAVRPPAQVAWPAGGGDFTSELEGRLQERRRQSDAAALRQGGGSIPEASALVGLDNLDDLAPPPSVEGGVVNVEDQYAKVVKEGFSRNQERRPVPPTSDRSVQGRRTALPLPPEAAEPAQRRRPAPPPPARRDPPAPPQRTVGNIPSRRIPAAPSSGQGRLAAPLPGGGRTAPSLPAVEADGNYAALPPAAVVAPQSAENLAARMTQEQFVLGSVSFLKNISSKRPEATPFAEVVDGLALSSSAKFTNPGLSYRIIEIPVANSDPIFCNSIRIPGSDECLHIYSDNTLARNVVGFKMAVSGRQDDTCHMLPSPASDPQQISEALTEFLAQDPTRQTKFDRVKRSVSHDMGRRGFNPIAVEVGHSTTA